MRLQSVVVYLAALALALLECSSGGEPVAGGDDFPNCNDVLAAAGSAIREDADSSVRWTAYAAVGDSVPFEMAGDTSLDARYTVMAGDGGVGALLRHLLSGRLRRWERAGSLSRARRNGWRGYRRIGYVPHFSPASNIATIFSGFTSSGSVWQAARM
jgi:hypothetical protein